MTLGSEFTFHGSISKPPKREVPTVLVYQVKSGNEWQTLTRVQPEKVEVIRKLRGADREGKAWRIVDASKPARRPRKATTKPADKSAEEN